MIQNSLVALIIISTTMDPYHQEYGDWICLSYFRSLACSFQYIATIGVCMYVYYASYWPNINLCEPFMVLWSLLNRSPPTNHRCRVFFQVLLSVCRPRNHQLGFIICSYNDIPFKKARPSLAVVYGLKDMNTRIIFTRAIS